MTHSIDSGISIGGQNLLLTYNSGKQLTSIAGASISDAPSFGFLWLSSVHRKLDLTSSISIIAHRGDGSLVSFSRSSGGTYVAKDGSSDQVIASGSGYLYTDAETQSIETYNLFGQQTGLSDISGNALTFTYSQFTTSASIAPASGYLIQITDNTGRSVNFSYVLPAGGEAATDGLVSTITNAANQVVSAAYDGNHNLVSLTWPDGKTLQLLYENASLPWALTGLTDERNVREMSWTYDSAGRAMTSTLAGGVESYSVSYGTPPATSCGYTFDSIRTVWQYSCSISQPSPPVVTSPNGNFTWTPTQVGGYPFLGGSSQPAGSGSAASSNAMTYDANGNLLSRDDFQGQRSCFAYDAGNREITRVEGLANTTACAVVTPANATLPAGSRKISTAWHPDWRIPTSVAQSELASSMVYHGQPDPFNNNIVANCTTAGGLTNGKPLPLVCKKVWQTTADLTSQPSDLIDASFSAVSLLLHGDDANNSTTFIDSSSVANVVTANGNARISTAQSKFGGSSIYLDGTGDYLSVPNSTGFDFGTADFTWEAWVNPVSLANSPFILHQLNSQSGSDTGWFLEIGLNAVYFGFGVNNVNSDFATFAATLSTGAWSHVAVTRRGSSLSAFVNGVSAGSVTRANASLNHDRTTPFVIGGGGASYFTTLNLNGYMDDVRVTKGLARYTANFTPPARAFSQSAGVETARTTKFTYDASGRVLTRTDALNHTTAYAYYSNTSFAGLDPSALGHTTGDLQSITDAAGHVTQFTKYDKIGRILQVIDPKGVVADTAYTPRGWISSVTVTPPGGAARTTSYNYDNAGQLTAATLPDGSTLGYSYDAAHRLMGVTDTKGNSVLFTLDAMGNRTGEQVKDPSGTLQRNITRVYDALNRVQQITGASN